MFIYIKQSFILLLITMCIGFSTPVKSNNDYSDRNNLMNCSAYHLKAKLYYQYFDKKKYKYHDEYFNNLNEIFLKKYPGVSQTNFILSVTSIMESWEYLAQEKGQSFASKKIDSDYKDLCNSMINKL
tara:strand:+ start:658 stop:1038 length:381 start_codon:yes stop_codon:yes gene_type:complete